MACECRAALLNAEPQRGTQAFRLHGTLRPTCAPPPCLAACMHVCVRACVRVRVVCECVCGVRRREKEERKSCVCVCACARSCEFRSSPGGRRTAPMFSLYAVVPDEVPSSPVMTHEMP